MALSPSKVPGYNLYIDGFHALRRPKVLQEANITHVVSVIDWHFPKDWESLRGFQHMRIPLDDVYDSNILEYFPRSNDFIHQALNDAPDHVRSDDPSRGQPLDRRRGGGVFIHCAMGVSRSATILVAYLLWVSRQPRTISPPSMTATTSNSASPPAPSSTDGVHASSMADTLTLPPTQLTVDTALALVRECRPQVEPNSGFIKQLRMYEAMGCPTTQGELESHKIYRRWINSRNVMDALSINRAPEMDHITFRDEEDGLDDFYDPKSPDSKVSNDHNAAQGPTSSDTIDEITNPDISASSAVSACDGAGAIELKCRKCRRSLAKSRFILPHRPPAHRDPSADPAEPCAHIFVHPLSWMRETLGRGELDGRLACPNAKCQANVGKFAWQGLRCSCGGWITPGFGLARGKVDQVRIPNANGNTAGNRGHTSSGAALSGNVRLPPGMRRGENGHL